MFFIVFWRWGTSWRIVRSFVGSIDFLFGRVSTMFRRSGQRERESLLLSMRHDFFFFFSLTFWEISPCKKSNNNALMSVRSDPVVVEQREQQRKQHQKQRKTILFTSLLAGSAGCADVWAVREYGCFVNLCTGNTFRAVLAICEGRFRDATVPTAVVLGYTLGVLWQRTLRNRTHTKTDRRRGRFCTTTTDAKVDIVLATLPSIVGCFVLADVVPVAAAALLQATTKTTTRIKAVGPPPPHHCSDATQRPPLLVATAAAVVACQAVAYGVIHTLAQDSTDSNPPVVFAVTGHWTGLSKCLADGPVPSPAAAARAAVGTTEAAWMVHLRILASFVTGIAAGSVLFRKDRDRGLLLLARVPFTAMGVFYSLAFLWYVMDWQLTESPNGILLLGLSPMASETRFVGRSESWVLSGLWHPIPLRHRNQAEGKQNKRNGLFSLLPLSLTTSKNTLSYPVHLHLAASGTFYRRPALEFAFSTLSVIDSHNQCLWSEPPMDARFRLSDDFTQVADQRFQRFMQNKKLIHGSFLLFRSLGFQELPHGVAPVFLDRSVGSKILQDNPQGR
jgi:uncharacterized membrane protein YoaK (UPF0700 family)